MNEKKCITIFHCGITLQYLYEKKKHTQQFCINQFSANWNSTTTTIPFHLLWLAEISAWTQITRYGGARRHCLAAEGADDRKS